MHEEKVLPDVLQETGEGVGQGHVSGARRMALEELQ